MIFAPEIPPMYQGHWGRAPGSRAPAACTKLNVTVWGLPQ